MILTEVAAPPVAALPVRAFADHLRLGTGFADDGSQDAVLELYLRSAMAAIEARLGRVLLRRVFLWTVERWREAGCQPLPVAPVHLIESVKLTDAEGNEIVVDPLTWSLVRDSHRPRLVGRFGRSLPKLPRGGSATIRLSAGFGETWDGVPQDLRHAVFLLASHYYENRSEAGGKGGVMPFGVLVLIEAYRATRIGACA